MKAEPKNSNLINEKLNVKHSEELGYHVPKDYFSHSKKEILKKVIIPKKKKVVFLTKRRMLWSLAASIALLFTLTVLNQRSVPSINGLPSIVSDTVDNLKNNGLMNNNKGIAQNTFLINSLFIEDEKIDTYVDNYLLEELVTDENLIDE